jgi:hypothetical protein
VSERRRYEIRVASHLGTGWSTSFEGMAIHQETGGETVLSGTMDQAALHGTLIKIRDLGLSLLSVNQDGGQGGDRQETVCDSSETRREH